MRELAVFWAILAVIVIGCAALLVEPAKAHEKVCEGVRVVDIREVAGEVWVQYTTLVHFGSPDLHMDSSPRWIRQADLTEQCGIL